MSKKNTLADEYRAFRRAMDEDDHENVVKYGIKLTKRKDFKAPPLIIKTIGIAYTNIAEKLQKEENGELAEDENWPNAVADGDILKGDANAAKDTPDKAAQIEKNVREAWRFLKKAYDAGAEFSPTDVVCMANVGIQGSLRKHVFLHNILAETAQKIKSGEYPELPKEKTFLLLEALASCCYEKGQMAESFDLHKQCLALVDEPIRKAQIYSRVVFLALYLPFTSQELFEVHKGYGDVLRDIPRYTHDLAARSEEIRRTGRKIRIGYITPDCRVHVAVRFFIGMLNYADREKFTTTMYSLSKKTDFMTEEVKKAADCFTDVSKMNASQVATQIYEDGIDILVDLAGHTGGSGLPVLAYKPAPVQMSGIGYLFSTGLADVDYFITDSVVDPPGTHEKYFVETPLYLTSQFSLHFVAEGGAPPSEGAPCRKNGFVTFGVFNNYRKITDEMILTWKKILDKVPNSRILLKCATYAMEGMVDVAKARFAALGVDVARLEFEPSTQYYMKRYLDVDIALDTYPYTGGGTTCDALYMGVPVVTLYGERRNTRFSLGILANMGLKYLAVDTYEKYGEMAVQLAGDIELLDTLHKKIRPMLQNSIVGRPDLYTKELEAKFSAVLGL